MENCRNLRNWELREENGRDKEVEEEEDGRKIIWEDFNAKSREGRRREKENSNGKEKKSIDKIVNKEGKKLIRTIKERGWGILNSNVKENQRGEFTYVEEERER
jgi:hypothetical protein